MRKYRDRKIEVDFSTKITVSRSPKAKKYMKTYLCIYVSCFVVLSSVSLLVFKVKTRLWGPSEGIISKSEFEVHTFNLDITTMAIGSGFEAGER